MSLAEELQTQEALDEAIKLLYKSRPAKAAALLGLVDPAHPISLAPKVEAEKVSGQLRSHGIPGSPANPINTNPGASMFPSQVPAEARRNTIAAQPIEREVSKSLDKLTGKDKSAPPEQLKDNISNSSTMPSIAKGGGRESLASLHKHAMTDQEYLMYQAGMGPMMEHTGDPSLTPTQLAAMGGGTVAVAGTNRMKAKNVARRELKQIRKQYIDAIREQALTKQQLMNLNAELKLRGAKPMLKMAPTVGIADAYMAGAEKNLTGKVLKNRYRGVMPLLAAGLIGTLAYNKLNEV